MIVAILEGLIISGDINLDNNEFILKKVKNLHTQSVLSLEQVDEIYDYLAKATHYDENHIVTINDKLPIRLNNEEVKQILRDFDVVKSKLNT